MFQNIEQYKTNNPLCQSDVYFKMFVLLLDIQNSTNHVYVHVWFVL